MPTFELADGNGSHPLYKARDAFTNVFNLHNSCLPAESYPMSGQATCFPRDTVFALSQRFRRRSSSQPFQRAPSVWRPSFVQFASVIHLLLLLDRKSELWSLR